MKTSTAQKLFISDHIEKKDGFADSKLVSKAFYSVSLVLHDEQEGLCEVQYKLYDDSGLQIVDEKARVTFGVPSMNMQTFISMTVSWLSHMADSSDEEWPDLWIGLLQDAGLVV